MSKVQQMLKVDNQCRIFGRLLYVFAFYTLIIKYIMPIAASVMHDVEWTTYIYFWDAWWLFHMIIGYCLIKQKKGVWIWALLLTLAEIVIITWKFILYLPNPNFDIWHLNWFINKCFLIVYFWVMFFWLFKKDIRRVL